MTNHPDNLTPFPTQDELDAANRDVRENGFLFPLTITSLAFGMKEPFEARIRRISTVDEATILGLPSELQDVIFEGLQEFQKAQEEAQRKGRQDPKDLIDMMTGNRSIMETADAWCQAAFIYPRLVAKREEIQGPDDRLVSSIAPEDRAAVLMLCLDSDSPQLKKLKVFRPSWGRALPHGENEPVGSEDTERVLETRPEGVQRTELHRV